MAGQRQGTPHHSVYGTVASLRQLGRKLVTWRLKISFGHIDIYIYIFIYITVTLCVCTMCIYTVIYIYIYVCCIFVLYICIYYTVYLYYSVYTNIYIYTLYIYIYIYIYIHTSHNWQIALDSFDVIMGIMKWLCLWCGHFVWSYYMISGLYSIYIPEIDGQFCIKHRYAHIQMWVWVNTYRYIFSGMNIHLPAILGFTRYQGFDPSLCIEWSWMQAPKSTPWGPWINDTVHI